MSLKSGLKGILTLASLVVFCNNADAGRDVFNCNAGFHGQTDGFVGMEFWVHLSFPIANEAWGRVVDSTYDPDLFNYELANLWNPEHLNYESVYTEEQLRELRVWIDAGMAKPFDSLHMNLEYYKHIPHNYRLHQLVYMAMLGFDSFDTAMSSADGWNELSYAARDACFEAILGVLN